MQRNASSHFKGQSVIRRSCNYLRKLWSIGSFNSNSFNRHQNGLRKLLLTVATDAVATAVVEAGVTPVRHPLVAQVDAASVVSDALSLRRFHSNVLPCLRVNDLTSQKLVQHGGHISDAIL